MSRSPIRVQLDDSSLAGYMLIAAPSLTADIFGSSVVLLCAHTEQGAIGLVLNKPEYRRTFADLLSALVKGGETMPRPTEQSGKIQVLQGGPIRRSHGFVMHPTAFFSSEETMKVTANIGLTSTYDILRHLAEQNEVPAQVNVLLGHAGWSPGQLEREIAEGAWFVCPADEEILFQQDAAEKYPASLAKLGISSGSVMSNSAGMA